MPRRSALIGWIAGAAAVAAVVAVSVVWPGLDAKRTPPVDASVWALQTQDGRRYARVNTAIGELDTVRSVSNPTAIAESSDGTYLFSARYGKVTHIDDALPVDLDDETLRDSPSTPSGTVEAAVEGDYVAYRTDSGAVFVGTLSRGDATQLDPYGTGDPEDDTPEYTAEAIAVDDAGTLYSYSSADGAVLRYRIASGELAGRDPVPDGPDGDNIDITAAGGVWQLVDLTAGTVWHRGGERSQQVALTGSALLGRSTADGDSSYIADEIGLVRLRSDGAAPERAVGGDAAEMGTPARPVLFRGTVYAAWLRTDGGTLWRSDGSGESSIAYDGRALGEERRPVFTATGSSMILNETRTGWVWTMPDGALVTSSQDWTLDDRIDPDSEPSDEQAAVVIDPKPPVAVPDAFGVRAGALVALPVLLNDHDPNEDVLSVDPTSVTGLDPSFGDVSITDDGQRLAVRVDAAASGAASFRYRVTDGTAEDGLYSAPTTVTLNVVGGNDAPVWCGVEGCLAEWPTPQVAPGGTVSVPVLNGWVDPDGDPMLLLTVVNRSGVGAVASTPAGDIVYQHPDAASSESQLVQLDVTVSDTRGATATKALLVRITPEPKIKAESFTLQDTQAGGLTVDVAPHVTGTAGQLALTAVRVLDDAPAEAVATAGSTSFDFTADAPGTYRVSYTVGSGASEATAIARITILPPDAAAQLATAPVIAFVRPKEDVTLDVFDAVANPTGRVLLLSDVLPSVDPGSSMTVDVVGQQYMRVTGTTATSAPGRLGTVRYTVSDGTEDAGSRIEGQATVYLLPPAPDLAPIAVDDSVVVRAGAQVDIPVLENDVAPSGGAITLNPASVTTSTPDALAFASGGVLRYLAPTEPGEYRIGYSIFSTGAPSLADDAVVRVTVIDDESNRAPRPETLQGRVLSGQATTIPFDQFGVDPDGDGVRLDRIVTQPRSDRGSGAAEAGSATISADGESIVYTSVPGFSGQVSFQYRVTDGAGASGTGLVRVGVLDEQSNPSPVTFTDYIQVQAGAESSIRVSPLANDIDPTGGRLALTGVRPDVVPTRLDGSANPEYARQRALIARWDDTSVVLRAGVAPGTMSFLYDVQSESGNTARGLIVVKVVRESVPDFPVVTDTLLTAETRERFPTGVDVVSGMVTWTGGDVSALSLALWGAHPGITADGWRISGALPEQTRIIPFSLSGTSTVGEKVTTYGFLRIPGADSLTLALRAGLPPQEVTERESVVFDMRTLVTVPDGETLEVGEDAVASGARKGAECARGSGTTVRYEAGEGAPWADSCTVPVRLSGQSDWTYLSVPVRITAVDPQPELHTASLTVGPGETQTYDLKRMTTWQWKVDWSNIAYKATYGGTSFDTTLNGSELTITGADAAVPGVEEVATVEVTSHPGVTPARLIIRVGAAPSTLPRGGTVTRQCSEAAGSSCTISVVGAPGEMNPLPRTPLRLVDVRTTGACAGVTLQVASSSAVVASWTADAPGATCAAAFSLRDAQGRQTVADRDGSLLLDLQGYPKAPAAVAQSAYDDGQVTLRVDPGDARQAYPALTGFVVRWNGAVVSRCAADGACPVIAAPNGEERTYEVRAVNDVGESRASVSTTAWAYDVPTAPTSVTAAPIVTSGEGGLVSVRIEGVDTTQVGYLELTSPLGETLQVRVGRGDTVVTVPRYRIGTNERSLLTVTPYTRFAVPPGLGGSLSGAAVTAAANGVGAPLSPSLTLTATSNGDGTASIAADGTAQVNGDGSRLRYGFAPAGQTCAVTDDGASVVLPPVADGEQYTYDMCVESWVGDTSFGRAVVTETVRAVQSTSAPTGFTFVVAARPDVQGGRAFWRIRDTPTSTTQPPRNNVAVFENGPPTSVFGRDPNIQVRWQHRFWGTVSDPARVRPAAGSAPYQVQASWQLTTCVGGSDLVMTGTSTNAPNGAKAAITFDRAALRYFDADGVELPHDDSWLVPVGAVRVQGIGVTADWSAQGWGLQNATAVVNGSCNPNLPPTPPDDGGDDPQP